MFRWLWLKSVALGGAIAVLAVLSFAAWAGPPRPPENAGAEAAKKPRGGESRPPWHEAEEAIRRALARPISVDFDQTPLDEAAAFLEKSCGTAVLLDLLALDEHGIKPDVPVSLRVSDITLRSVLRLALREHYLTYVVRDEVLLITTPEEAETRVNARVYPVGDIVGTPIADDYLGYKFSSLQVLITTSIQPDQWDGSGPPDGAAADFGSAAALVFSQTDEIHEEIASLLAALRAVARQTAEGKLPEPILFDHVWPEPPAYGLVRKALWQNISVDLNDVPLDDAIEHLRKVTGLNVVLDGRALKDMGIAPETPISVKAADAPLRSALEQMLDGLHLTYQVWDEVLLISTQEEADLRLTIGIYPLGDLLGGRKNPKPFAYNPDPLEELIQRCVEPKAWSFDGGPGTVQRAQLENVDALVIVQTRDVHRKVGEFLARVRRIAREIEEDEPADPTGHLAGLFGNIPAHEPAPAALSEKVDFNFENTPLRQVADDVSKSCGIECRLDGPRLKECGWSPENPVSMHVSGITLRSALELIVGQLELTWIAEDGGLLITTPDEAEKRLALKVHRVDDLVVFRDQNDRLWDDYYWLIEAIRCAVMPDTWVDSGGGPGWITSGTLAGSRLLIVCNTDRVHEAVDRLLVELREVRAQASPDGRPPRRHMYYGGWSGGIF